MMDYGGVDGQGQRVGDEVGDEVENCAASVVQVGGRWTDTRKFSLVRAG